MVTKVKIRVTIWKLRARVTKVLAYMSNFEEISQSKIPYVTHMGIVTFSPMGIPTKSP